MSWTLARQNDLVDEPDAEHAQTADLPGPVLFPFNAYGRESLPQQQDFLVTGATVWTNESQGNLVTNVLVRDGEIAAIGDNLSAADALLIDGSGKHLTPGIIDEHSHIALFNINEIATNSSMVRMQDVVDSESINIYRNLAGGVVAAQLLQRLVQSDWRPVRTDQDALGVVAAGIVDRGCGSVHQVLPWVRTSNAVAIRPRCAIRKPVWE